jgi:hypothetical protein
MTFCPGHRTGAPDCSHQHQTWPNDRSWAKPRPGGYRDWRHCIHCIHCVQCGAMLAGGVSATMQRGLPPRPGALVERLFRFSGLATHGPAGVCVPHNSDETARRPPPLYGGGVPAAGQQTDARRTISRDALLTRTSGGRCSGRSRVGKSRPTRQQIRDWSRACHNSPSEPWNLRGKCGTIGTRQTTVTAPLRHGVSSQTEKNQPWKNPCRHQRSRT